MLIGILSDTHLARGERRLSDRCVERLRSCDLVLHAGDFTAASVLEQIEAVGPPVAAVHGNVDCSELRQRLPETRTVDAEGARIAVAHDGGTASGRLERLRRRAPAHTMGLARVEGGRVFFEHLGVG